MMSRIRITGQRRDSAAPSRREDTPAPATDHPGPRIWTWLETVSLPRYLGRPARIAVNLAGAAAAALQSISLRNALVMVLASGCNAGRALMEERLLARSPAYGAYLRRVPWRLVPGLW
jgi:hypothetical protein